MQQLQARRVNPVCLLRSSLNLMFHVLQNAMAMASAAESLIFAFHANAHITRFQLPSAKNLFPQSGMCAQELVAVLDTFKSRMENNSRQIEYTSFNDTDIT